MIKRIHGVLITASDALAVLGGWVILVFAVAVTAEVILRKFFQISLQGIDEYGGYVLAVTSSFGFTYALVSRSHIRVDVLLRFLPLPTRGALHVCAMVSLAFYACMIVYSGLGLVEDSWQFGARAVSPLKTPLILPQSIWLTGLGLFAIASIVIAARAISCCWRRDWREVERVAGISSAEDEVAEEMHAAKKRWIRPDEKFVDTNI